ncbi:unnamed protein product [Oikopleura dioica]|uniref:Uncharacterized protein n=1 Tax=Oikopleura dioica TaxID=34765 RepID=E4XUM9_OIKDI|nr:unnamed protein product [Oikopleura dioica]
MKISQAVSRYTPDVPSSREIAKVVNTGVKVFDKVVSKVSNSASGATKDKTGGLGRAILDKGQSFFSSSSEGSHPRSRAKEIADNVRGVSHYAEREGRDFAAAVDRNSGGFWDTAGKLLNSYQGTTAAPTTQPRGMDPILVGPIVFAVSTLVCVLLAFALFFLTVRYCARRRARRRISPEFQDLELAKLDSRHYSFA